MMNKEVKKVAGTFSDARILNAHCLPLHHLGLMGVVHVCNECLPELGYLVIIGHYKAIIGIPFLHISCYEMILIMIVTHFRQLKFHSLQAWFCHIQLSIIYKANFNMDLPQCIVVLYIVLWE